MDSPHPTSVDALPLTGERTVPGVPPENYWFRRHEVVYDWCAPMVAGADVLEVGSGEGYGTALLAGRARRIVGLDYDAAAAAHAARRYPPRTHPAARFVRANLAALPVATGAADVLVSLQVVEHVWDHGQFVRECRRVLRADGLLIMSTPNRLTFSPGRDTPLNPFHTHEFTGSELTALLRAHGFDVERLVGLHPGERLRRLDARWGGSFVDTQLATPPQQWAPELLADVAAVSVEDFALVDAGARDIDASLDLVVLARPTRA